MENVKDGHRSQKTRIYRKVIQIKIPVIWMWQFVTGRVRPDTVNVVGLTLKMKALLFILYGPLKPQISQHHIPEDGNLQQYHCDSLKSHIT